MKIYVILGVDDAFLMISAWNRRDIEIRNGTVAYETIRERIAFVSYFFLLICFGRSLHRFRCFLAMHQFFYVFNLIH